MGLNEAGVAFGNCLAHPADNSDTFTESPNYSYSNNQAFKQFILGETASLTQARQAIEDNTNGFANDWPQSIGLMPGIFDANGRVSLWEIGDNEYYEYDPENPNRLAQMPWQIYARDNTVHTQIDHTDDWSYTANRYVMARDLLIGAAADGGNTITNFIGVARAGEPGYEGGVPSRISTSASMIAHGVLPGEDPRVATMWTALGQPDYACFVPVWTAIADDLSARLSNNDLDTSLAGASERLLGAREPGDYDLYINSLIEPMEANFISAVEAARIRWLQTGFDAVEARRIHQEASETAWRTMDVMASGGGGRNLNITPELTAINASANGLTVSFGVTAGDPDGFIASYDWNFGDGVTSSAAAPVHTFLQEGTYLVRSRVTDDSGSRNSRWAYITLGPSSTTIPVVTIAATDAAASESGSNNGTLVLTRSAVTADALTVNVSLSGSADEGDDYQLIGSTVTIPAGSAQVTVAVIPVDDLQFEDAESVIVTLAAGSGYVVGARANAMVSIADDDIVSVIQEGDTWRYFRGTSFPGATWNAWVFDDSGWLVGDTGIGYGDGDDNTVLNDMRGSYITVYMRRQFTIADASTVAVLEFIVDYDDGFVAFINGVEVARRGVPVNQDENTTATNHESGQVEFIDISGFIDLLVTGANVIAIEVHNYTLNSSDLSMIPELQVWYAGGGAEYGAGSKHHRTGRRLHSTWPLDPQIPLKSRFFGLFDVPSETGLDCHSY